MAARAMRKMHVPTYWPWFDGVQEFEKRGVRHEVKKTMSMSAMDMDILSMPLISPDIDVDEAIVIVEVPVAMSIP